MGTVREMASAVMRNMLRIRAPAVTVLRRLRETVEQLLRGQPTQRHPLEQARKAELGHGLVGVGEIAVIPVCPGGDARCYLRVQLRRIHPPLLARVAPEEFVVQLAANFAHDDVFRGQNGRAHQYWQERPDFCGSNHAPLA